MKMKHTPVKPNNLGLVVVTVTDVETLETSHERLKSLLEELALTTTDYTVTDRIDAALGKTNMDPMPEELVQKIAKKWMEAARMGCVDPLESALRETWEESRDHLKIELPKAVSDPEEENDEGVQGYNDGLRACRAILEAAGFQVKS